MNNDHVLTGAVSEQWGSRLKPLLRHCGESYMKWINTARRYVIQERIMLALISSRSGI